MSLIENSEEGGLTVSLPINGTSNPARVASNQSPVGANYSWYDTYPMLPFISHFAICPILSVSCSRAKYIRLFLEDIFMLLR